VIRWVGDCVQGIRNVKCRRQIVHSITLGCFDILRPVAAGSASLSRNEAYGAEKIASCRQTGFFNRIGTKQTCCNVL
jgi:hypothetical protein